MKVKIIKSCSDRNWYRNEIGNIFDVEGRDDDGDWRVLDDADLGRYIAEEDFIIINEDWKPLEADNLPPDILTWNHRFKGTHEIQYFDDSITPDTGWVNEKEGIDGIIQNLMVGIKYRYRLRKYEPTVDELAEEYANNYSCYKIPIKEAYIAGYNKAKES